MNNSIKYQSLVFSDKWFQVLLCNNYNSGLTSVFFFFLYTVKSSTSSVRLRDRDHLDITSSGQGESGSNSKEVGTKLYPELLGWSLTFRWFSVITRTLVGWVYSATRIQSVYFIASLNRSKEYWYKSCICNYFSYIRIVDILYQYNFLTNNFTKMKI